MWFSVFVGLVILLRIGLFLYFTAYGQFVDNDSALYLLLADNLLEQGVFSENTSAPFDPEVFRTPGYPFFIAVIMALGMKGSMWIVFWQELIYLLAIVIFYQFGKQLFDKKIVRAGLIFLLIDPGGLVLPKLIMSELLFLFFFIAAMLALAWYFKFRCWQSLLIAGLLLGLGALIRPAVMYFPVVAVFVLLFRRFGSLQHWWHAGLLVLSFLVVFSPWLIRNYYHFDKIFVTGQQGTIFVDYHLPIVLADVMEIPREQANVLVSQRVKRVMSEKQRELGRPLSVVEEFQLKQRYAVKELTQYPLVYLKQWLYGGLKTMNGPFITQLYDSLGVRSERVHYADAVSRGVYSGIIYYFKNLDGLFLINVLLTMAMAGFALLGVIFIMRNKDRFLWLMMLANFYFIFLAGPEGYPRFRSPVGLFWFIQAYLGFVWSMSIISQWRGKIAER